jgi:hypothetical protein
MARSQGHCPRKPDRWQWMNFVHNQYPVRGFLYNFGALCTSSGFHSELFKLDQEEPSLSRSPFEVIQPFYAVRVTVCSSWALLFSRIWTNRSLTITDPLDLLWSHPELMMPSESAWMCWYHSADGSSRTQWRIAIEDGDSSTIFSQNMYLPANS